MSVIERESVGISTVGDVMTPDPLAVEANTTIAQAARLMADGDVGDLIVVQDGELVGIVTDRDIVVRALATGRDTSTTEIGEICSRELVVAGPDEPVADAAERMRSHALRRLIVVDDVRQVAGVLSLGDLAELDLAGPTLAGISDAPPNV